MSRRNWYTHVLTLGTDQHCRHIYDGTQQQNLRWIKNAKSLRARMDVALLRSVAHAPRKRLGPFYLDSSSQFLHVFILVPESRFDLMIRITSTSPPSRVSPVKSFRRLRLKGQLG